MSALYFTKNMHLLFDSRVDVVSTIWKDDDYDCGEALCQTLTFTTGSPELLWRR
jgi:hypothetical protein